MKKHTISILLLIAYTFILVKVMVFKDVPLIKIGPLMLNFGGTNAGHAANFIPFKTILPYLFGDKGLIIGGINLIGNIILLVPFGFLVPMVWRKVTWKETLVLAGVSGLVIEILQVVLRVGIFDIDDVILNALGVMIGYWIFVILAKWIRAKKYKNIVISFVLVLAAIVISYSLLMKSLPPMNSDIRSPEVNIEAGTDLCGGTGGLGEIIRTDSNTISIKRNDGVVEVMTLTDKTEIKIPSGSGIPSDLKIGDRVTVVTYTDKIAVAVLVCGTR